MGLVERVMRAGSALVGELGIQDVLVDHHERAVVEAVLDDARRVVVKGDLDAERSAHEARVLDAAAREGVPVPRVLARAPGPPALLVLDHVPGGWLAPERHDRAWAATGAFSGGCMASASLRSTSSPGSGAGPRGSPS